MQRPPDQHLTVKIEGVVLPTWGAIALLVTTIGSIIALLMVLSQNRETARELRILQVHTQDIENVLIRRGIAKRDDFAAWGGVVAEPETIEPQGKE